MYLHLPSCSSAAIGRGTGGRMSGAKDAASAGVGVAKCLSEQNQNADGLAARSWEERAGAEGFAEEGSSWTEGNWYKSKQHTTEITGGELLILIPEWELKV